MVGHQFQTADTLIDRDLDERTVGALFLRTTSVHHVGLEFDVANN